MGQEQGLSGFNSFLLKEMLNKTKSILQLLT